jgi:sulfite exporter TauE/SafE
VTTARPAAPAVAWDWSHALLGVVYAVPAAGLALVDPAQGLAAAVAAIFLLCVGAASSRRAGSWAGSRWACACRSSGSA